RWISVRDSGAWRRSRSPTRAQAFPRRRGPSSSRPSSRPRSEAWDWGWPSAIGSSTSTGAPSRSRASRDAGRGCPACCPSRGRMASMADGRILIADDEDGLRWVLEKGFRGAGYQVTAVKDGSAALAEAVSQSFDLILLDVKMPG